MSEKKERGRPTKYKPEYCLQLVEHMAKGLSFECFAAVIGVNRDSLNEWAKVHPDFSVAKSEGLDQNLLFWENLGIEHIINKSDSFGEGQSSSRSINASVYIFNMKNRHKWRDRQPDETDVVVNNINGLSIEDLDKKIAEKIKKLGGGK